MLMPGAATTWMFAALNKRGPPILEPTTAKFERAISPGPGAPAAGRGSRPQSLSQLSARPGDADWLDGAFSEGDLMMVLVLLRLRMSAPGRFRTWPPMSPGGARPAYQRAFAAELGLKDKGTRESGWAELLSLLRRCGGMSDQKNGVRSSSRWNDFLISSSGNGMVLSIPAVENLVVDDHARTH